MSKRFYITTAIDYVNGQPHLGHAYEKVITDVIARSRRSLGEDVFFLTGLDEHGQKVQQAATAEGKSPQAYCDELAQSWKALTQKLGLSNDDFVRTTETRHKDVVQSMLTKLHQQGDLYSKSYEGWYSWRQEAFLTDKDRSPDGTWDPIYGEVTKLVEHNWFFKMGQHQEWLIDFLEKNPNFVTPGYRLNEVLGFLRSEKLDDLCISRPKARLSWGIPIPFAPDYVNYVWFDALVNYISIPAAHGDAAVNSALGLKHSNLQLWPADAHVIGKDILRFHAVYWPIMLKAAGLPLPKQIVVHGWWQKDGQKISKTTGNVIDPIAVIDEWSLDAFRYYVVRELAIGPDGNWTNAGFAARYEAELVNGLGNLLNRSLKMLKSYRGGKIPARANDLAADSERVVQETTEHLRENGLQAALVSIWNLVNRANKYVEETAPFKLAKDPSKAAEVDRALYNLCEACRVVAVLLHPFLPVSAEKMYVQLGLTGKPDTFTAAKWGGLQEGHVIGEPAALFPRKENPA